MKTSTQKPDVWAAIILTIVLSMPTLLSAQPANQATLPEEIIVNAPESLRRLRLEVNLARENMFNVFNRFIDDERFEVHCDYVKRWQSKIREQVCTPTFHQIAREQEANNMLADFGFVGANRGEPGVTQIHHLEGQFEEKMKSIFQEHPEFREAIGEFESLSAALEDARKERFELDD